MKDFEKSLGLGSIKTTKKDKLQMRQLFELQISTAALLRGNISLDKYLEIIQKRLDIRLEDRKPALK